MYRVAFDPALPVVAASPFKAAGQDIAAGDAVDWRGMGLSEMELRDWWLAGLVVHPLEQAPVSSSEPLEQAFHVAPGELVTLPAPTSPLVREKHKRHERR